MPLFFETCMLCCVFEIRCVYFSVDMCMHISFMIANIESRYSWGSASRLKVAFTTGRLSLPARVFALLLCGSLMIGILYNGHCSQLDNMTVAQKAWGFKRTFCKTLRAQSADFNNSSENRQMLMSFLVLIDLSLAFPGLFWGSFLLH